MLKAVIFDFDGVVADSEMLHYKAFNMAFEPFGVFVEHEKYYNHYLGYSDVDGFEAISKDYGLDLDKQSRAKLLVSKEEHFKHIAGNDSCIIDGVAEFISMLKSNNIRMAICSGALRNEILMMLSNSNFADVFEIIVAADDVTKGKPDPEPYLLTLERLNASKGLQAGECIVVEDSFWGLQAAKAAGMHTIGVTNTYPVEKLAGYAEKVVNSLSDLEIEELISVCSA